MYSAFYIFLIIIFFNFKSYCQISETQTKINSEFNLAVSLFDASQYDEALKIFDWIINKNEINSKTTPALLITSKILIAQKKFDEAENILSEFIFKYAQSIYIDEARILLADLNIKQTNYVQAVNMLLDIIEFTANIEYNGKAKLLVEKIIFEHFDSLQIKKLIETNKDSQIIPYLYLIFGKYLQNGNKIEEAKNYFYNIIENYPSSEYHKDAVELYTKSDKMSEINNVETVFGAFLPDIFDSTNMNENPAKQVLAGIEFAIDQFNKISKRKIGLIIRDTKRNNNEVNKIFFELSDVKKLKGIIGSLYSDDTRFICEVFNSLYIPIISPTSTENELTKNYKYFFQANPSIQMRGRTMAQFIFYVENKKKIAILSSKENYSNELANSFAAEFKRIGGKIITHQSYMQNSTNVAGEILTIKKQIKDIEGIYIPIQNKLIANIILAALMQNGILTNIYGNQDWFLVKGLESTTSISNKLIFESDYFIDYKDPDYIDLNKDFYDKTGIELNRNALYGYDAAKFMLSIFSQRFDIPEDYFNEMTSKSTTQGLHNNINFSRTRINRFLNIVRYKNGKFELIDRFLYEDF